ncbi:polysaccharide pyruvyl transferase CsaB [Oceanobacillus limi]|uniref:Polysaccharide pyruvyl transferase CsaB n=1 Tax=Oceanobacillus limi TaxID=930131 RepID=A0A1I0A4A0_9BACI|nr:polysaccharide pyruvyl transferase family protein [Oceanobacillus limi]SES88514.1 polysaccharide pyruvyl transferase CsaB [Oceanobacillus limi]
MAIGIVGNYGNDNEGDEAILEGVIVQLEEAYEIERKEIVVFSNNPEQISNKHGVQSVELFQKKKSDPMKFLATVIHNKPIIRDLDLLIIGGGGILMDLYRNGAIIYGMYGWLAKLTNTPYVIYGAGAGPISTLLGRTILKSLGNSANLITVRDPKSKALLESIGVKKPIHVISDPAFFVKAPKPIANKLDKLQIGVTAVPYYNINYWPVEDKSKYNHYINGMATNLDNLLREYPNAKVNFFSTKHPYDTEVTKDIRELMRYKGRSVVYEEEMKLEKKGMNHKEILQFIGEQDIVIGTRLHSLILSLVTNIPIIAISYHQKVKDFMDSIDCSDLVIPIDELSEREDFFLKTYMEMEKDWSETVKKFETITNNVKNKSPKGMDLVKTVYKR